MQEILQKIYPYNKSKAVNDIIDTYERNGFVISNFIYFATIKAQNLFESKKTRRQKEYKKAIMKGDFLFPDGVALQIFYNLVSKKFGLKTSRLSNLNGTDFIPYFLDELKKRYGSQRLCIHLYGAKLEMLVQAKKFLQYKGFTVYYTQDGFSDFNRDKMLSFKNECKGKFNILLVARSTLDNPIQELWVIKNYAKIKRNNLIVFTVGGLFDFWAGEILRSGNKKGAQKRAPKFIRKMKLEWLWRLITDPRRNFKKVKYSFTVFSYIFRYLVLKKE